MKSVLIAPLKYVQGPGVLAEVGQYTVALGRKPLLLWDSVVKGIVGETMLGSIGEVGLEPVDVEFQGESTHEEVKRVADIVQTEGADVVIGVGGGKALDTAKAVAAETNLRIVTVPTIASNDSPTSSATVWYNENGDFQGFECWAFNPDVVLVDSQVIARGPARAFVAGMGDALSTWVETEAAFKTRATNLGGGISTRAAIALARLGYDLLMEHGIEALRAVENDCVTPAVERVIEANVLLSGLGFESGGLATAHMIANTLPSFPECKSLMHGEKVGFGIISQLVLDEDTDTEEMLSILDFEIAIGLPVTFADLNLEGIGRDRLMEIGRVCAGEGSLCANHAFPVTAESIVDAMIIADALGRSRKELLGV